MDRLMEFILRIFGRGNGRGDFQAVTSGWQAFSEVMTARMDKALDRIDRLEEINAQIHARLWECEKERTVLKALQEKVEGIQDTLADVPDEPDPTA